ncbi:MAG: DUF4157 domain-containing protein [Pirellulaceae bacterium]
MIANQSIKAKSPTAAPPPFSMARNGLLQRKCDCGKHTIAGGQCQECENKKGKLQRNSCNHSGVSEVPPIVHEVLNSSRQPLDTTMRAFFEPRFGHDFSGVRIHTGAQAAKSAQSVNARAYTVGSNVVFGAGQFAPQTNEGRQLLAHELTHVAQQSRSESTIQPSLVNSPDDAGEREAEMISQQVLAGEPVPAPRAAPTALFQRKALNKVETDFQSGAKACVVHLHGEERTALAVAKEIRTRRCVNLVHLDTTQRNAKFEVDVPGETEKHICEADPNRVFTDEGLKNHALKVKGCHLASNPSIRTDVLKTVPKDEKEKKKVEEANKKAANVKSAAFGEIKKFVQDEWGKKISECRGGDGSSVRKGALPILAIHNNEGLTLDEFKNVAEKGDRLPADSDKPGNKLKNPSMKSGENPSDFFLVTKPGDFTEIGKSGNVLLQADPIPKGEDDGSLSVAVADQRFINVEKEGRAHDKLKSIGGKFKGHDSIYIKNYAMAAQALDAFGVAEGACFPATSKVLSKGDPLPDLTGTPAKEKPVATPTAEAEKVLDRDPVPAEKPANCTFFEKQAELDLRKVEWKKEIARMPLVEIVNWIVGSPTPPPANVTREMTQQRGCMTTAMAASLAKQKLKLPTGNIIKSELRTYSAQEGIWENKWNFKNKSTFGQISDIARKKCVVQPPTPPPTVQGPNPKPPDPVPLIPTTDKEWNPADKTKNHLKCWNMLTNEEKEKEILMTSSAPGVSRHHAGTDFDFGQTDKHLQNEAWTGTGDFADAYSWLARNASRYGFMQPFNTKGGYGKGYTEERWHWSYYPIAQALLEFAKEHQKEIDEELQKHWKDKPEYEFISKNWRDYLFNVETKARF